MCIIIPVCVHTHTHVHTHTEPLFRWLEVSGSTSPSTLWSITLTEMPSLKSPTSKAQLEAEPPAGVYHWVHVPPPLRLYNIRPALVTQYPPPLLLSPAVMKMLWLVSRMWEVYTYIASKPTLSRFPRIGSNHYFCHVINWSFLMSLTVRLCCHSDLAGRLQWLTSVRHQGLSSCRLEWTWWSR